MASKAKVSMWNRVNQVVFVVSSLALSWLCMLATHEFGHVLGAWATGGEVQKVVLHPLAVSRVDISPNPKPLAVVWAGPVLGCLIPLAVWWVLRLFKIPAALFAQFIAGICLIANGCYIGLGSFWRIADAGTMLQHGSEPWQLWLFGSVALSGGLWLCHGLGPRFGLGENSEQMSTTTTYTTIAVLLAVVLLEMWLFETS